MTARRLRYLLVATAALVLVLAAARWILIRWAWKGLVKPPVERLWSGDAPLAIGTTEADIPTISVYLPPRWHSTRAGAVICPGGAYRQVMSSYEGNDIARWLNSFGIAGFVLNYRIGPRYHHPAPLQDATRAMRFVRYHAARFGLETDRLGIIGFSAGGHLASTVATHFDSGDPRTFDQIDRVSSRPDFAILGYPIISMEASWTNPESLHDLLGPNPDPALIQELSNEKHITSQTPPTFLFHTRDDAAVPFQNSVLFCDELRKQGVACELHLFDHGPHGAGLADGHGRAPRIHGLLSWSALAERWLDSLWPQDRVWSYSFLIRM